MSILPSSTLFRPAPAAVPLKLGTVLPLRAWLAERPWAAPLVVWFAFLAFFPFVLARLFDNAFSLNAAGLRHAFWGLGLYYHVVTGFILFVWLRPPAISAARILGVCACTVALGVSLVLYGQQVPILGELYTKLDSHDSAIGYLFGVGPLEECAKALPVAWLFLYKKQRVTVRECAFLAAVSGLAFGVAECPSYCMRYAAEHLSSLDQIRLIAAQWQAEHRGADPQAREVLTGILAGSAYANFLVHESLRLISLPLLHALMSGVLGTFIGLAANLRTRTGPLLFTGLLISAGVHGAYDALESSPTDQGWAAVPVLLIFFLFVGYARSAEKVLLALRAEEAAAGLTPMAAPAPAVDPVCSDTLREISVLRSR